MPSHYQPIENYGLIVNMRTAALVGMDGSIDWLCWPNFDSPSVFAAILDDRKGGRFRIAPEGANFRHKQFYWPDTAILITRFLHEDGVGEIEDYMPVGGAGPVREEVIRRVRVARGRAADVGASAIGARGVLDEPLAAVRAAAEELAEAAKQPEADPFDLLCNVAYSAPIRTRRERADAVRVDGQAFFGRFTNGAREVLNQLLEKYVEFGTAQFQIPDILKVPPISDHGNVMEIAGLFGGADRLRGAVEELQQLVYAA